MPVVPKLVAALTAVLVLLLAACSPATATDGAGPSDEATATTDGDSDARAARVAEVGALLPDEAPDKVVVMSVALAEILDALGVVPAAVPSSQTPLPDSLADVPRVGSVIAPDIEQITALQPDLILGPAS